MDELRELPQGELDRACLIAIAEELIGYREIPGKDMDVRELFLYYANGYLAGEKRNGNLLLLNFLERDIIPITTPIPHENNKTIRRGNFSFSTNQAFPKVLRNCFPRKGRGAGRHIRRLLLEARNETYRYENPYRCSHSIEVWQEDCLVGGAIIVQIGGYVASVSVFRDDNCDGAGNAAALFLQKLLVTGGFVMHDSGIKSDLSCYFGGYALEHERARKIRQKAVLMPLDFPTISDRIPFEQISNIRKLEDGWSFPCKERYAPKEQGGGETFEDFQQASSRNCGGSKTGYTRPSTQSASACSDSGSQKKQPSP